MGKSTQHDWGKYAAQKEKSTQHEQRKKCTAGMETGAQQEWRKVHSKNGENYTA